MRSLLIHPYNFDAIMSQKIAYALTETQIGAWVAEAQRTSFGVVPQARFILEKFEAYKAPLVSPFTDAEREENPNLMRHPEAYERRADGKVVAKDRWKVAVANIWSALGGARVDFEIDDVVDRVRYLIAGAKPSGWVVEAQIDGEWVAQREIWPNSKDAEAVMTRLGSELSLRVSPVFVGAPSTQAQAMALGFASAELLDEQDIQSIVEAHCTAEVLTRADIESAVREALVQVSPRFALAVAQHVEVIEQAIDVIKSKIDEKREPGWSYRNTITVNRQLIREECLKIRSVLDKLRGGAAAEALLPDGSWPNSPEDQKAFIEGIFEQSKKFSESSVLFPRTESALTPRPMPPITNPAQDDS